MRAARRAADLVARARAAISAPRRAVVIGAAVFVSAAVAFRLARLSLRYWGIDDAGITYAASYEFADHGSLAAYLEGPPIEGYSNPLVFFIVAALRFLGIFNAVTTHLHLETIVFATTVSLVWAIARRWTNELAGVVAAIAFAVVELVTPSTRIWYGSGLENVWVSAAVVSMIWLCSRAARGDEPRISWGVLAFVAAITRPEAPVYVAAFYCALALFSRTSTTRWRVHIIRIARALAVTTVLYIAFLLWRRIGYGGWLPNTYYAKLSGSVSIWKHISKYVVVTLFPYACSLVFACAVFALIVAPEVERFGAILFVFLAASLALPITAGADWMGEHRFGTAFFVVAHVTFAVFCAICAARFDRRRIASAKLLAACIVIPVLLVVQVKATKRDVAYDVSIAHVAQMRGADRWEQQMRLGLPYPVVLLPDAGGTLLVGGVQLLDDAALVDFQLARMPHDARRYRRMFSQYEHEERRPDLVDGNPNFAFDDAYLGTRYVHGEGALAARKDRVELAEIDPGAHLIWSDGPLKIYLSPRTVSTAAPSALVRCELIAAWTDTREAASTTLRASLGSESDHVSMQWSVTGAPGLERRTLLLGAPAGVGTYPVTLQIVRDSHEPTNVTLFSLEVTTDERAISRAAGELAAAGEPAEAAFRLAWLREQLVPRLGIVEFHELVQQLVSANQDRAASAGREIERFRWNARLAALENLPQAVRDAELVATRRLVSTCSRAGVHDDGQRILCLGRTIDELRRLDYLRVLARAPEVRAELDAAASKLETLSTSARYRTLVGLVLADPSSLVWQRALLNARKAVAAAGDFPEL